MTDGNDLNEDFLEKAKSLVSEIQSGNEDSAQHILENLISARESKMFMELGKLTREFHDALMSFRLDSKIADLAETDIPDAKDRLNHVINMTNESAEKTLGAVETSLPLCEKLSKDAAELKESWARFQRKEMQADEFRALTEKLSSFLAEASSDSNDIKDNLNTVLMAQSFQDLTGQIIKRVITLVDDVEQSLVNLVKLSSSHVGETASDDSKNKKASSELEGPQIPGKETEGAVSGQDEVDDLLSSLGF